MTLLRAILGWLARHALLFALIVAGLVAWTMLAPSWQSYGALRQRVATLDAAAATLPGALVVAERRADAELAGRRTAGRATLEARIAAARRERQGLLAAQRGDLAALVTGGPSAIVDNRVAAARIAWLDREIATLGELLTTADVRRDGESVADAVRRHAVAMRAAAAANRAAVAQVAAVDAANPYVRLRARGTRSAAVARSRTSADAFRTARASAERLVAAQRGIDMAGAEATRRVAAARADLARLVAEQGAALGGNRVERLRSLAERLDLAGKARAALLILGAIILTPLGIRGLFYHVLAPIAERRPAIRLRPADAPPMPTVPPGGRSAVSIGLRVIPGEELLVRQGFLQTTAWGGAKRTRLLLDWRHPLTSLAAGLWFLTRLSGDAEAVTTISATDDAFAEVTELTLPAGAAVVLLPRALVAVIQPINRPMRIESRWRLFSLHAWLTLQLRYLIFHGPARLVVMGGRGVRIEPAERGRILGQDQLLGFGTDLAYAVTRNETFLPYLAGREPLLRDRVIDGGGVLIVEEAPRAGRRGGGVRHGLEGAFDAALKIFGV